MLSCTDVVHGWRVANRSANVEERGISLLSSDNLMEVLGTFASRELRSCMIGW